MIQDSFFKEEVRDGFLITEEMKRTWAAELRVLKIITTICEEYGLRYYCDYGTLLGAVRHRGYVPWDDDIDIALMRKDYMRLLSILQDEFSNDEKRLFVHSYYTSEQHLQPMTSVLNRKTVDLGSDEDKKITEEYYQCPYIAGVDVYPLDHVPDQKEDWEIQKNLYNAVYDTAYRYQELKKAGEDKKYIAEIEYYTNVKLDPAKDMVPQLWRLADQIAMMYAEEDCEKVIFMPDAVIREEAPLQNKIWYQKSRQVPFEMLTVNIPEGYDEILQLLYGEYEIPVNTGGSHNYPYYQEQKKFRERSLSI